MAKTGENKNMVLFPFMAQGHIIPFMELALQIEQRTNYEVTIVNTPMNIKKLRSSLPPNSSIRFLELPFTSSDHGLPPNTENTDALPYNLVIRLLEATNSLVPTFKQLVHKLIDPQLSPRHSSVCVIADLFFGWTASVAKELGVFHAFFCGNSGYGLACYCSFWMNLPYRAEISDEFSFPDFPEANKIHKTQISPQMLEANGGDAWSVFQGKNFSQWVNTDGILFNSVEEFDKLGLLYFRRKFGRPVWTIGPVLSRGSRAEKKVGIRTELCREWLNTKPVNSVLYVSFGSMNTISASQMMQLAMALEASGTNFIWVVRPPIGFDINSEFKADQWLPEGFEARIQGSRRGLIVHNWAPQMEILSHRAVSAFLSHCGWNSAIEALSHGVPILGWPMAGEQFFNSKFLEEEVGVSVEVARGKSCEVRHEDVKAKIELVMNETEKGKEIRTKACKVKEIVKNAMKDEHGFQGSSVKAMNDFFSVVDSVKEKIEASNCHLPTMINSSTGKEFAKIASGA
ncbi:Glycosyltransferase [Quillaja saponaria]|uniref:Glycosyltransferase n=1 Tax=Quillaja saponaria TaxID=32244 RepID=A0AAD7KX69_QUISA|nr:Glycosyltransferase [Quillaja saponaria]KAJ7947523.1 Glycosyltransferase [Quillaja saponaria]